MPNRSDGNSTFAPELDPHARQTEQKRLKREHHALQALGEALIELPEDQLRDMPLDEDLFDAIVAASQNEVTRRAARQRQLIGKLMRNVDAEPIREALDAATQTDRSRKPYFVRPSSGVTGSMADGREALTHFLATIRTPSRSSSAGRRAGSLRHGEQRRRLGRRIFRAVHPALRAKVHNGTP